MGIGKKNSKFLISRGLQLCKALFLRPRKTAGCIYVNSLSASTGSFSWPEVCYLLRNTN